MSAPHTPGPWEVPFLDDNRQEWVTDANGALIATMEATGNMENDARLIAAAPDLLDALIAMVDEPQPLGITRPAYKGALTAIAKATGDAP